MNRIINKKTVIRILSVIFCLSLIFSFTTNAFEGLFKAKAAIGNAGSEKTLNLNLINGSALNDENYPGFKAEDVISVIVELKDDSISQKYLSGKSGMDIQEFMANSSTISYAENLVNKQNKLLSSLSSQMFIESSYNYTTVLNGFAAQIKYKNLATLEKHRSVKSVMISEKYSVPKTIATENNVNVYGTGIYDSSNIPFDGENTVVAVLDTGLDYTHTAFQKMPAGQLALTKDDVAELIKDTAAYNLSKNREKAPLILDENHVYYSDKVPFMYDYADKDPDVYPINDHGTHVAGIIGGQDQEITGVATETQLAIMKVFSNEDAGAGTVEILAAIDDCITLNVDVINMSLGTSAGFSRDADEDGVNTIYDRVKEMGISLIVAASNDYSSAMQGAHGDTNLTSNPDSGTIGSPASYAASMAVASISGVKTKYMLANGDTPVYFNDTSRGDGEKNDFIKQLLGDKKEATFEYVTIPGTGNDSDYIGMNVEGKIALVKRGDLTFERKVNIAYANNAKAIIIYNNVSGNINMSIGSETSVPSCSINMDLGNILSVKASGTLKFGTDQMAGPFMSDFSSWGVLPDLELKPDITAHGGDIYSAVRGGYDRISGTSMACPNMAGATVLVREYVKKNFPKLNPYQVTELTYQLMMSSTTIANNEYGNPYSPRKQGSGLADIYKATNTGAYLWVNGDNKTKLSLGDDKKKTGVYEMSFNLTNISGVAKSYVISPSVMTETVSSDLKTVAERAYMLDGTKVDIKVNGGMLSGNTIAVAGKKTANITVKITLTDEHKNYLNQKFENGMFVEGFINFKSQNADKIDLSIPWLAFYGDWTAAPMFDVSEYEVGESLEDSSILEKDKLKADVYATLPMGSFNYDSNDGVDEGFWGLGQYGYKLADGYTQPVTLEDQASITTNGNGLYKFSAVYAGLLRGAKEMSVIIKDSSTGKVIYDDVYINARKSYFTGSRRPGYVEVEFDATKYGLQNNAKYEVTLQGKLDYEGEHNTKKNTFSFSFYIDNEAPEMRKDMTALRVMKDGSGKNRYYLDMYVYDNHYIQCYSIYTYKSIQGNTMVDSQALAQYTIPVDSVRGVTNKVTLDITEHWDLLQENGEKLYVEFLDYARNQSAFTFELPRVAATDAVLEDKTSFTLNINEIQDIKEYLKLTPNVARFDMLTWTSSDESVCTVNDGVITGVKAGSANIIVTSEAGLNKSIPVTVRSITGPEISLTELRLNKSELKLTQGDTFVLKLDIYPWNFDPSRLELNWVVTNGKIAKIQVDPNDQTRATVTALYEGGTRIRVEAKVDGKVSYITATCNINVKQMFEMEGRILKAYHGVGDENGVVVIPDNLNILYIYQYAFFGNKSVKKVVIPEGVTEIMDAAFYGMDNLEEVVLPKTMELLREWAFGWNKKLSKINLENVVSIEDLAFYNCSSLNDIELKNVHYIGANAFYSNTSLTKIDISNVGFAGENAFSRCSALNEIIMSQNTVLGEMMFVQCNSLTNLFIPTKHIGPYAFYGSANIKSIVFTEQIRDIGEAAFAKCSALESIIFMKPVESIGSTAFAYASALKTLNLPSGIVSIGETAFANCDILEVVNIPSDAKLSSINRGSFAGCPKLSEINVANGNMYLSSNDGILYDRAQTELLLVPFAMNVRDFVVPSSVRVIGRYAFSYINLKKIDFNNVVTIDEGAFYGCTTLSDISYGSSLREIGKLSFYGCTGLKAIALPEGLRIIGESAFAASTGYNFVFDLVLPSSLVSVDFNAFRGVNGLRSVVIPVTLKVVAEQMFAECLKLEQVTIENGITEIKDKAFAGCKILDDVVIPNSVVKMGEYVFYDCQALSNITLSNSLSELGEASFAGCTSLESVTLPSSIKKIGAYAFYQCGKLMTVNFDDVETVGELAFFSTSIEKVVSDSLTVIEGGAFGRIANLKQLTVPNIRIIGDSAFYGCTALKQEAFDIENVQIIEQFAFSNCTGLETLNLPNVMVIGKEAFANCTTINEISVSNVEVIGVGAFMNTHISSFNIGKNVSEIGVKAFYKNVELGEITVDSANKNFTVIDGVLYEKLDGDKLMLVYYPEALTDNLTYEVADNTVKVEGYAFAGNRTVVMLMLPESLLSIGDAAFFETNIRAFVFLGDVAPLLESSFDSKQNLTYRNFIDDIKNSGMHDISIYIPRKSTGYNEFIWKKFFDDEIHFIDEMNEMGGANSESSTADEKNNNAALIAIISLGAVIAVVAAAAIIFRVKRCR